MTPPQIDHGALILMFNIALGIVATLGGFVIRDLSGAIRDLRNADQTLSEKIGHLSTEHATRQDLRELRAELSGHFTALNTKLESMGAAQSALAIELSQKLNRNECDSKRMHQGTWKG